MGIIEFIERPAPKEPAQSIAERGWTLWRNGDIFQHNGPYPTRDAATKAARLLLKKAKSGTFTIANRTTGAIALVAEWDKRRQIAIVRNA